MARTSELASRCTQHVRTREKKIRTPRYPFVPLDLPRERGFDFDRLRLPHSVLCVVRIITLPHTIAVRKLVQLDSKRVQACDAVK